MPLGTRFIRRVLEGGKLRSIREVQMLGKKAYHQMARVFPFRVALNPLVRIILTANRPAWRLGGCKMQPFDPRFRSAPACFKAVWVKFALILRQPAAMPPAIVLALCTSITTSKVSAPRHAKIPTLKGMMRSKRKTKPPKPPRKSSKLGALALNSALNSIFRPFHGSNPCFENTFSRLA